MRQSDHRSINYIDRMPTKLVLQVDQSPDEAGQSDSVMSTGTQPALEEGSLKSAHRKVDVRLILWYGFVYLIMRIHLGPVGVGAQYLLLPLYASGASFHLRVEEVHSTVVDDEDHDYLGAFVPVAAAVRMW